MTSSFLGPDAPYTIELADPLCIISLVADEKVMTWKLPDPRAGLYPPTSPQFGTYRMRKGMTTSYRTCMTEEGARVQHWALVKQAQEQQKERTSEVRERIHKALISGILEITGGHNIRISPQVLQVWEQMGSEHQAVSVSLNQTPPVGTPNQQTQDHSLDQAVPFNPVTGSYPEPVGQMHPAYSRPQVQANARRE